MGACESCGRTDEGTEKVQRIYLVPTTGTEAAPADREASATATAGDIEEWCASCRATFPHVLISED